MWLMDKWEKGSYWLYDKIGKKIQPAYDEVDSWKTPDWAKKIFEKVWDDILDPVVKKKLYTTVMDICKKYDTVFAKELLEGIKKVINKWIKNNIV